MRSESYRLPVLALALATTFVLSSNLIYGLFPSHDTRERFTELWLLGANHRIEGLSSHVLDDEPIEVMVGIRNHMGDSVQYSLIVKLRNETEPLPDPSRAQPSPLPMLCRFDVSLDENEGWEAPVTVRVVEADISTGQCLLRKIEINGAIVTVKSLATRNEETTGFCYELFFELWTRDSANDTLLYDNRFVGFWLDVRYNAKGSLRTDRITANGGT